MRPKGISMKVREKGRTKAHLTALAEAMKNAKRLTNGEIATYLDAMLQFAPCTGGTIYRIGNNLQLFSGLLHCMEDAVACDLTKLKAEVGINNLTKATLIWRHLDLLDAYFQWLCTDDFEFCPAINLFYKLLVQEKFFHGPYRVFSRNVPLTGVDRLRVQKRAFFELISDIQAEAARIDLAGQMEEWQFPANSNIIRANAYAKYPFNRSPEVTVIELVVSYPQSAIADGNELEARLTLLQEQQFKDQQAKINGTKPKEPNKCVPVIPPDTLKRDMKLIFEGMKSKRSLFKGKIGHATNMAWSRAGGHYASIMLLFDRPVMDDPIVLCDRIGDYITERLGGRMVYVSCNRNPDQYPETGVIRADDAQKRGHLLHRLLLWAQKHQFLSIKASSGFRTFTTGDIPKAWQDPAQLINRVRKPHQLG
jgi:hypothetical protein